MSPAERSNLIRRSRPRGHYVPVTEAQMLLERCGWRLLDDCPAGVDGISRDECLLLPPGRRGEAA
jgi:hypothetical protein